MSRPTYKITLAVTAALAGLVASNAQAANWQKLATAKGEQVALDMSRISRDADGRVLAWVRLSRDKASTDSETGVTFTAVEVQNSYDCKAGRFMPVKRVYMDGDTLLRVENIYGARDLAANASGSDAALMSNVCSKKTLAVLAPADSKEIQETREAQSAKAKLKGASGVMRAEMVAIDDQAKPAVTKVSEQAAAEPKRFIELPKIDKSQVERPSDEKTAKPAEKVERPAEKPMQAVASKLNEAFAETDRRTRELAMATSGPRRVVKKKPAEPPVEAAVEHQHIHWSYDGEGGPSNWANLDSKNALCASGKRQSPIDIGDGIKVDLESIKFNYRPTQFRIEDNGHTIQVNVGEGSTITVMGRTYELKQFHFHRPSEERVKGQRFDMVAHLVHKDDEGNLAVVAVLMQKGESEHPLIQTLWNNMPLEAGASLSPATPIEVTQLLPESRAYYTYMGSLTTPPCSENVLWMVFKQPITVTPDQVAVFSRLYRNNARPIQPAFGRLIKESR